ncbi:Glyoxal oxidase [Pleurotus pulmonarius]
MLTLTSTFLNILALLHVAQVVNADPTHVGPRSSVNGRWGLVQEGTSGVSAMQLAVVTDTKAIVFDKVEHNPLTVDGHPAWAAEIDLPTRTVRPLNPISNTFCATGSFLSNGTMVHTAGNPFFEVDIGVTDGISGTQSVRLFTPCDDASCDLIEDPDVRRLTSRRWYTTSARLEDGSVFIYGGSTANGFITNATINNPTYEFFPPKNINGFNGVQIPSQFLLDTLIANQFPNVLALPDGNLFIAANQQAMLFNWKTNTETRLPNVPNGVRISYPFSAGLTMLPLTPENNFTPEILTCGGAALNDSLATGAYSSQSPTSNQCARLVLTRQGIAAGWKVEHMPQNRTMVELILLPDGRVLMVNGMSTGVGGYGTGVFDMINESNADHPVFTPLIYDPNAAPGKRFSLAPVSSNIARMYHSTATLIPDGSILLAGSNPNSDVIFNVTYPTEYRMEFLSPPYMFRPRPTFTGLPATLDYGATATINVNLPRGTRSVTAVLMDLGFATHGVHMDQRLVHLRSTLSRDGKTLRITGPANPRIYSPGPGFLFIVTNDGVPSEGKRFLIGTGAQPPVDQGAIENLLRATENLNSVAPLKH